MSSTTGDDDGSYLIFCTRYPEPWNGGDAGTWGIDHLVRLHGWSVDEAARGSRIDAGRIDRDALAIDSRHTDEHGVGVPMPVPHTHDDTEAVLAAIVMTEYSTALKVLLGDLLDLVDANEKYGGRDPDAPREI